MTRPRKRRLLNLPHFRGPDFRGKKVILVGPAATVTEELEQIDLDDYDFVGRMNNSINTPLTYRGRPFAYHNLYIRNQQRNTRDSLAGRLDRESAQACGTEVIIFVLHRWREVLRLMRKVAAIWWMGIDAEIYVLCPGFFRRVRSEIDPVKPSLGFIALTYLMDHPPARLDVVGFTFFTTKYIDNYNDRVAKDDDAYAWATRNKKHDPNAERTAFRRMYEQAVAQGQQIHLGAGVRKAIGLGPQDEKG